MYINRFQTKTKVKRWSPNWSRSGPSHLKFTPSRPSAIENYASQGVVDLSVRTGLLCYRSNRIRDAVGRGLVNN